MTSFNDLRRRLQRLIVGDPGGTEPALADRSYSRLTGQSRSQRHPATHRLPTLQRRPLAVRQLEPRLVLNATAELTGLGQLVISGQVTDDYVRLDVDAAGRIGLWDQFGAVIEITGNPAGADQRLAVTDITSGQIHIDLGGGNDTLDLTLPGGVDVTVAEGDGHDVIQLSRAASASPLPAGQHQLAADAIRLVADPSTADWSGQRLQLSGDVYLGNPLPGSGVTSLWVDAGHWSVDGRVILQGDVQFVTMAAGGGGGAATAASIDFSDATLSADRAGVSLSFALGQADGSLIRLGIADDQATTLIEDLRIDSAGKVQFTGDTFHVSGQIRILDVAGDVSHSGRLQGQSLLVEADRWHVASDGEILVSGDATLATDVTLSDDLQITSSDGNVRIAGTVDGPHGLTIAATAGQIDLQDTLGDVDPLSSVTLHGHSVRLPSTIVSGGDIDVTASVGIDLIGDRLSVTDSGQIELRGPVILTQPTTTITAPDAVRLLATVTGRNGTESLVVRSAGEVQLQAEVTLGGSLVVEGDRIQIAGNLSTGAGSATLPSSPTDLHLIASSQIVTAAGGQLSALSGGVVIDGPLRMQGDLTVVSRAAGLLAGGSAGGDVWFAGTVDGPGVLAVQAIASSSGGGPVSGGHARFDADLGATQTLGGLNVQAESVVIPSVWVQRPSGSTTLGAGDLTLQADTIQLTGDQLRALDGDLRLSGEITISSAAMLWGAGPVPIGSAGGSGGNGSVAIHGSVRGASGDQTLTVSAAEQIDWDADAGQLSDLTLTAGDDVRVGQAITVAGDFTATAASIHLQADLTSDPSGNGTIRLTADRLVQVDSAAAIRFGHGALLISSGDTVQLNESTIVSSSAAAVVQITATHEIALGNLDLVAGTLSLNSSDAASVIEQNAFTTIAVQQLRGTVGGNLRLENAGNDFQQLGRLTVGGRFALHDSQGDLTIQDVVVSGDAATLSTVGDLRLQLPGLQAAVATVQLTAGGAIVNASGQTAVALVQAAELQLRAQTGIGAAHAVTLQSVATIDASTVSGGIDLQHQTASLATVNRLDAQSGVVRFQQTGGGDLLLHSMYSGRDGIVIDNQQAGIRVAPATDGGANVQAAGSGAIQLTAATTLAMQDSTTIVTAQGVITITAGGDVTLDRVISGSSDDRAIAIRSAAGAILDVGSGRVNLQTIDGGVQLTSHHGIGSSDPTATDDNVLRTDIDRLTATVDGVGSIAIQEQNAIELIQLVTADGTIAVSAVDRITVVDNAMPWSPDLSQSELVAGGQHGQLRLTAGNVIEIEDQVRLVTAQSTAGAVQLSADQLWLGESIEINTGAGTAIAKYFLPRPEPTVSDTAFYDATTVQTDILSQANDNDAQGTLTLQVGRSGERGLQLDIDWGAPSNRFQTVTDIDADGGLQHIRHVYLESDILHSTLNGRTSATAPLEVRFAVSHHESIQVHAGRVTQGFDAIGDPQTEAIPGRLASSTDNPLTAGLESGTAQFVVPNLTIPIAFVPVRDVVPVVRMPEPLIRPVDSVVLAAQTWDSPVVAVAAHALRDEYFQLRILSTDPDGEDLAEPQRLPDDIMAGNRLQQLFVQLPDGRYQIEYVVSDGDHRPLLTVDVRDGATKVLIQDVPGGALQLERLPDEWPLQPSGSLPADELLPADEPLPAAESLSAGDTLSGDASLPSVDSLAEQQPIQQPIQQTVPAADEINRYGRVGRFISRTQSLP